MIENTRQLKEIQDKFKSSLISKDLMKVDPGPIHKNIKDENKGG